MSTATKHFKFWKNFWFCICAILTLGPLGGAFIYSLASGELTQRTSYVLGVIFIFVLILTIVSVLTKWNSVIPFWIFIFTVMYMLRSLQIILFIYGACSITEEIVHKLLYNRYRNLYITSKGIDKREAYERAERIREEERERKRIERHERREQRGVNES